MSYLQRRNQADVLRELFDEETINLDPEKRVRWLLDLFSDHVGRFVGVTQSLRRPFDDSFFESDFVNNLFLVSDLIQQEVRSTAKSEELESQWQIVSRYLDDLVRDKSDHLIDGLTGIFQKAKHRMLAMLG